MKDKEMKLEGVKVPHTLVGVKYILSLCINSDKEVVTTWRYSFINHVDTLVSCRIQSETGFG